MSQIFTHTIQCLKAAPLCLNTEIIGKINVTENNEYIQRKHIAMFALKDRGIDPEFIKNLQIFISARQVEAGRRIRITGQRYFKMDWSFFFSPRWHKASVVNITNSTNITRMRQFVKTSYGWIYVYYLCTKTLLDEFGGTLQSVLILTWGNFYRSRW